MNSSKKFFHNFKLAIFLLSLTILNCMAKPERDWKQYVLPESIIRGDVMTLQISKEYEQLLSKFQESIKNNPEWAAEFFASIPSGQPLPFHQNLGLTQEEYDQMSALEDEGMSLKKISTINLEFQSLDDGKMIIVTDENTPINNLIISDKKVSTEFGDLTTFKTINNNNPNAITGPWKGVQWEMNTVDEQTLKGQALKFCLGKLDNKDQGLIYYDVKILQGTDKPANTFSYIVFFPLTGKKQQP